MKKLLSFSLVAMLGLATLAGCSTAPKDNPDTPKDEPKTCAMKIGFVTDMGGIDDKSFNQSSWEGIQRFAADNDIDASCIKFLESKQEADYVTNLSTLAEEGMDLIAAAGFLFNDAMAEVSTNFPDSNFFVIDTVVEAPNVLSGVFAAEQASYLAGVAAAAQAEAEGKTAIGYIGGMESELIAAFQAGYEQGALSVNPDIQIFVDYVGDFANTATAQTLAQKQYEAGAAVIYHASGNAGNGVIKEAKERTEAGNPVWVIGVDRDQYADGTYGDGSKSVILTSALKRVDNATYLASKTVLDGTFAGGTVLSYSIMDDGVGYPTENPNLTAEIIAKVDEAVAKLKDGSIVVETVPSIKNGSSNKE